MIWLLTVCLVLTWLCMGFLGWILWETMRQSGRILARLDALERGAARPPELESAAAPVMTDEEPPAFAGPQHVEEYPTLPMGAPAPAFRLPDLTGKLHSLDEWRGRRVVLVFFSPRCGFCTQITADLATAHRSGAKNAPVPVVITNGSVRENREWMEEYGVECAVLRQEGMEVAHLYEATGTPMGYLIDEEGRIASKMAVGGSHIVDLLTPAEPGSRLPGQRALSESKIPRDGLRAGTEAPPFTLPRIGGGTVSLAEYRGRRVALVFSDPQCGPCLELAPELEAFHRRNPGVELVMISRGDEKANREKVREFGLTFPVALQKRWEVSQSYAMFATPVGYLVDERGVIAADVAVGVDAILAMLQPVHAARGEEVLA